MCGGGAFIDVACVDDPHRSRTFKIVRCRSCKLEFVDPVADRVEEIYDEAYYRSGYLDHAPERSRQFRALIERLAAKGAEGPLLDVGCGVGLLLSAAQAAGWAATGVDPASAACAIARERFGVQAIHGDAFDSRVDETKFGVAVFWHTLSHMVDPAGTLRRVVALLRDGGWVVMSFLNWQDPRFRLRGTGIPGVASCDAHVPSILWRFRESHLVTLAERSGLQVEEICHERKAVQVRYGWRGAVLNAALRAYRSLLAGGEEIHVWCRKR